MKKLQKLKGAKTLSKNEQREITGGMLSLIRKCVGTGTGGHGTEGFSQACVGRNGDCTINGYLAACSGNNGGFWYY